MCIRTVGQKICLKTFWAAQNKAKTSRLSLHDNWSRFSARFIHNKSAQQLLCRSRGISQQTRKPSWRKGYVRQRRHSKMAVRRHLGFYRTGNSAIRSADPKNPCLELNMEWIGCTVCEIFAFKLHCDLETEVWGHLRSLKAALFDRAHTTLYSSSTVTTRCLYLLPFEI